MNWRFWQRPLSHAKIEKIAALAANPFAQPDVRVQKMERLLEEMTPAALAGVLRRFATHAQGHIADEEEKQWLVGALVEVGEPAIAPLEAYIRQANKLTHALAAYARLVGDPAAARFFAARLEAMGPEDHQSSEAKLQLVGAFVERTGADALGETLAPFLLDHSDDVRWAVIEALEEATQQLASRRAAGGPSEVAGEPLPPWAEAIRPNLVALCTRDDVSARIARRAARYLAATKWPWLTPGAKVAASLNGAWGADAQGRLVAA